MTSESIEQSIVNYVLEPHYQPVKPRVIAKKLGVGKDELPAFRRVVKRLVKSGRLSWGMRHLVYPPGGKKPKLPETPSAESSAPLTEPENSLDGKQKISAKKMATAKQATEKGAKRLKSGDGRYISGTFRRAHAGFGFVRPSGVGPSHLRENDIFVAAADAQDAASGDVVLVELKKKDTGPRRGGGKQAGRGARGRIVEIIERETNQFVGVYFESGGNALVQVDGTVFARPILVGDPGAKNAQPDDKVVFEMVRFPTQSHDGEGVIVEVLGARGEPGVETLSIIREYDLPDEFPAEVLDAAREEARRFDDEELGGRLDLTEKTIITIDPVDARDFDDAISLERSANGHWMLGVHIADVAHFVPRGSVLDREAHQRATSVYLPDRVLPMLPEIISNGLASLQPDKRRYARTVFIEFSDEGAPIATEIRASVIRSCRRFTYEEVDEYLADRDAWRAKLAPEVYSLLARMHELAMKLRSRRIERGALELSLAEVKIDLDKDGRVVGAHRVQNTVSHQIIEEFMLAANIAVAEQLHESGTPFLRRIHMPPDPRKVEALNDFVAELGVRTDNLESRFVLQRLLRDVEGQPEQHAVHYVVLRSLQQAVYGPEEEGHYALAAECYCHFTSPIRRYPDLTVHRLCETLEARRKPRSDLAELRILGEHCSQRERRAEQAERELTKVKLLAYLSEHVGSEMEAVVTGVEEFGLFAQGIELPAEGLVHITSLADDYYHYDRRTHSLTGRRENNRFRMGDRMRVAVARVDVERRELDFRVVLHEGREVESREAAERPRSRASAPARGERKKDRPRDEIPSSRDRRKQRKKSRNKK